MVYKHFDRKQVSLPKIREVEPEKHLKALQDIAKQQLLALSLSHELCQQETLVNNFLKSKYAGRDDPDIPFVSPEEVSRNLEINFQNSRSMDLERIINNKLNHKRVQVLDALSDMKIEKGIQPLQQKECINNHSLESSNAASMSHSLLSRLDLLSDVLMAKTKLMSKLQNK